MKRHILDKKGRRAGIDPCSDFTRSSLQGVRRDDDRRHQDSRPQELLSDILHASNRSSSSSSSVAATSALPLLWNVLDQRLHRALLGGPLRGRWPRTSRNIASLIGSYAV